MLHWTIEKLNLHLKFTWKLSRNATDQKTNFYIKVAHKGITGIGEVAPNIRYGETPEKILSEFAMILNNELPIVKDYQKLQELLHTFRICNSLKAGIDAAYVDFFCKKERTTPFDLLGLKKIKDATTAFTVPIMPADKLNGFFLKHDLYRFKHIKVKVDKENGLDIVKEVHNITDQPLMIDANEAWTDLDELLWFIDNIKSYNIEFIEQPMPARFDEEYAQLKTQSALPVFADESITNEPDFAKIKRQFHGINMKIMKAGGLANASKIIKEARLFELKTMVGCMVETSVGIANGLYFAGETNYVDLDSHLYLENEPSGRVIEKNGILSFHSHS